MKQTLSIMDPCCKFLLKNSVKNESKKKQMKYFSTTFDVSLFQPLFPTTNVEVNRFSTIILWTLALKQICCQASKLGRTNKVLLYSTISIIQNDIQYCACFVLIKEKNSDSNSQHNFIRLKLKFQNIKSFSISIVFTGG